MKLKIKVTKEILKASSSCTKNPEADGLHKLYITENCAIALAVRDIFPSARVYGNGTLSFFGDEGILNPSNIYLMPQNMIQFIHLFDRLNALDRMKMNEAEFEIDIPDEVIEKINIDEIKPLLQNHPTLELVN